MAKDTKPPSGGEPTGPPEGEQAINNPISFAQQRAKRGLEPTREDSVETGGGGGGPPNGNDVRIAILETQVAHVQSALGDIRAELRGIAGTIGHLPTKHDLFQNMATVVIIGLTVITIVIGGIIGGLAILQPKAAAPVAAIAPQPIVIQLPPQSTKTHP